MKNKLSAFRFLFTIVTFFSIANTVLAENSEIYIPTSNSLVKLSIIDNGENSFNPEQKNSIIEAVKM